MFIPFVPFPAKKAAREAMEHFSNMGGSICKAFPSLKLSLYQAKMDIRPIEYASLIIMTCIFYFVLMTPLIFFVGLLAGKFDLFLPLVVGTTFSSFIFFYLIQYPKLVASRRMRILETDLLNSLQHMLIEIKSGVPLFNAMISISTGYGEISEEFKKTVKDINAGKSEIKALEEASRRNPSLYFRRTLWQLTNSIKAGSDIGDALEAIVHGLTQEQIIAIRKYGQELSPYTLIYMLFAIIMPTLGITFLIILSSFAGIAIPKVIFPLILIVLAVFQYFYMGMIKTKRPIMVR
jgi:archaeal flagellar protein FlaJ